MQNKIISTLFQKIKKKRKIDSAVKAGSFFFFFLKNILYKLKLVKKQKNSINKKDVL